MQNMQLRMVNQKRSKEHLAPYKKLAARKRTLQFFTPAELSRRPVILATGTAGAAAG
jgi:hypothetical protein